MLKWMLNILKIKIYIICIAINHSYQKEWKFTKCNKLVCNLYNKKEYVVHIRALKQALNHGLILKKVHRVIQFNQGALLKPYVEMNTKLRTEAKNDFEQDFF